jgi:arabinofuranosyltransferase
VPVLALAAAAVSVAFYVVRLGGDFMHGRMLLPPLLALSIPVALWPIRWRSRGLGFAFAHTAMLMLLPAWAVVCAVFLRVPYRGQIADNGLADEVNFYRARSGVANPVAPEDYRAFDILGVGRRLRNLAASGERSLVFDDEIWPLGEGPPVRIVTDGVMIGVAGYVAGPQVHLADFVGLADPIGSRLLLDTRGRPGHEKWRSRDWLVGRYIARSALGAAVARYPQAAAAAEALACAPLVELQQAVVSPLTLRQFVANIGAAIRLTRLRVPAQPFAALSAVCGRANEPGT